MLLPPHIFRDVRPREVVAHGPAEEGDRGARHVQAAHRLVPHDALQQQQEVVVGWAKQ